MEVLRLLTASPATLTTLAQTMKQSPAWVRRHLLMLEAAELDFAPLGLEQARQPAPAESNTAYRRHIALVMQDPLLFDMSVFENVASGLRFRGAAMEKICREVQLWLERLGVGHGANRRAGQLSGGESQRVSLARALVLQPRCYFWMSRSLRLIHQRAAACSMI